MIYMPLQRLILYNIIDKQEHPDLNKADKKRLCRILDCQKLSADVRAHAVKNERLPLRTVVQVLFFEQESGSGSGSGSKAATAGGAGGHKTAPQPHGFDLSKLQLGTDGEGELRRRNAESSERVKRSDGKLQIEETVPAVESRPLEPPNSGTINPKKLAIQRRSKSEHKGRDR